MSGLDNKAMAAFLSRTMVGLVFAYAGWWKVFELGALQHAERFFLGDEAIASSWIPHQLLWITGVTIPFLELGAGILVLIGYFTRWAMVGCGVLLLLTTYGHLLQNPLFDIDGHTFTRLALIIFWLLLPMGVDQLSVDHWRKGRRAT